MQVTSVCIETNLPANFKYKYCCFKSINRTFSYTLTDLEKRRFILLLYQL